MEIARKIMKCFNALTNELYSYFSCSVFNRPNMIKGWLKTGACGSMEIVTQVDKEVEDISIRFLSCFFPEIPVFGEEHYQKGSTIPVNGWVFIIDPIDGTSEFARGSNEWSISLTAVYDLIPRVGMLFLPQYKLKLFALKGDGIFCNKPVFHQRERPKNEKIIAVSPRQIKIPEFSTKIVESRFTPLPISTLTIKIVSMLRGKVDAAVYFPQKGKSANVWDYAAAILFIEELGGEITSFDGSALSFRGQEIIHRNGWLATNSHCDHETLLSILRQEA